MSFSNKVMLITGASSGIGAACAEYFAKEYAILALVDRNAEKFKAVVEKIKNTGTKNEPLVILGDVSVDAERIICETIEKYNRLDILINNAGFSAGGSIENTKMKDFDAVIATNVRGVFHLTQLAIPYLIASKGNIVNVSSVLGLRPHPRAIAYSMSKSALDQLTKCIALDLAEKGVRVNSVNPGYIDTNFHYAAGATAKTYPTLKENFVKLLPIGRIGESSDVVRAISFLADDNAGFITGILLAVDGGMLINFERLK